MRLCRALVLILLLPISLAFASGWNDYSLEIAPGFFVYRMNSFQICLGRPDGKLLICPEDYPGLVGPLSQYAVTENLIMTRHMGVRPNESNPTVPEGDPQKEYYFAVGRADHRVTGPLTRAEWAGRALPSLSSFEWVAPKNPNFWMPLVGNLTFLVFVLVFEGWPFIIAALVVGSIWLYRRGARKRANAA